MHMVLEHHPHRHHYMWVNRENYEDDGVVHISKYE